MGNMTDRIDSVSTKSLLRQAFDVCADQTRELVSRLEPLPEAVYFLELMRAHYDAEISPAPKVIVFGTDFPTELVHSLTGEAPWRVTGGSRILQEYSDDSVPRDTDPVTRAALGELFAHEDWRETALVIVPCSSDAQRKAAFLLQSRGWRVVTIWIPAVKDAGSYQGFLSELDHAVRVICRHVGKRYSVFALNRSARYFNELRGCIARFQAAACEHEAAMPGVLRLAVLDRFFLARDLDQWKERLCALTEALKTAPCPQIDSPRAPVIGSPIRFPNYKLPGLLLDAGISLCGWVDEATGLFADEFGDEQKGLEALAHYYFEHDSSGAFVRNDSLMCAIREQVDRCRPDGIIWHVLKRQIEYDFELNRCEAYFEEKDLPVIRLETDYQYQDIEQLRIRIEAFGELMSQKRKERSHE